MTHVISSPHLRVFINGSVYGKVRSFSYSVDRSVRAIRGVDELLPAELAEGPVSVQGTMDVFRLLYDGGLEGSMIALPHKVPLEKYVSIQLIDRRSDVPIFQTDKARVIRYNYTVRLREITGLSLQFEAIGYTNESLGSIF